MIGNENFDYQTDESNFSIDETNKSESINSVSNKLKDYGKKSLSPFIDVLRKYRSEIDPYFSAISKGLEGGVNALRSQSLQSQENNPDQIVAGWFQEASNRFGELRNKFSAENPRELLDYLEQQSKKHPGVMFSTSYAIGLFVGRVGRHIGRKITH